MTINDERDTAPDTGRTRTFWSGKSALVMPGLLVALGLLLIFGICLLYTSPSPRDLSTSRMPSSA